MGTTRTCSKCGATIAGTLDRCQSCGAAVYPDEVMARLGLRLKDHEILGVIGLGGMGVVYRARHVVIEKPVAIKVLHDHFARQQEMVEQFLLEAKAASRIRHPNVIDVTDFGTTAEGVVFLVMEYLDGESLEERLARVQRVPVFEAVNIVRQVARGLGAAHEQGIVHRDLKPANIFLCAREGRRRIVRRTPAEGGTQFTVEPEATFDLVKLLDFGVAKFMNLGPSVATRVGALCGTPHYLSPEQAMEKPATQLSDIYALGVAFYEMLTGRVPFDGSSMLEILTGHVSGQLVPPSERVAGIPPEVDAVIARCMEKDPARRFATADELGDALGNCVADRAFLRDAHRLPGIEGSGIDLTDATPGARRPLAAPAALTDGVDPGFLAVEDERPVERPGQLHDKVGALPDGDADLGDDTMVIGLRRRRRLAVLVGLLAFAVGAGVAVWALRGRGGAVAHESATGAPAPPATAPHVAAAAPVAPLPPPVAPEPEATVTATPPGSAREPAAAPTVAQPMPAAPTKPPERPTKTAPSRPYASKPPVASVLPSLPPPPAPEPVVAAPPPSPAPEPAVDVDALVREAQQAYMHRYYALAMEKARDVLKASPGKQTAYQIIAASSCALGEASEAREAVGHLDEQKRKMVQGLCQKNGVSLE